MEYATPIWDPYLRKDIDALEKVQCKAAQWVKHNILTMSASPVSWPNWNGYRKRITMLCLLQKMQQVQWIWTLRDTLISITPHVLLELDPGLIPTDN